MATNIGTNPDSLRWQPPTENTDGTPVKGPLSYNLYRGDAEPPDTLYFVIVGELQQDGTYIAPVENFPEGEHFIALTAVDADGDESDLSNVLQFRIGVAPRPPVLIV